MKTPHKHAELIKAWADGAEIEWRRHPHGEWLHLSSPNWLEDDFYRIKPVKKSPGQMLYEARETQYPVGMRKPWETCSDGGQDFWEQTATEFLKAMREQSE